MDFYGHVYTSKASDEDQTIDVMQRYSSRVTLRNLSSLSLIEWILFRRKDLHPSVSLEPFIEDEMPNPMAMLNFAYVSACSSTM